MKKAKINILKSHNVLIATVLSLLGFSASCGLVDTPVMEYGTPSAKFIVNGKVVASETNEALNNIRVTMQGDTTYTDNNGNYQVTDKWGFPMNQSYNIQFQDIDGSLNGQFNRLDTMVEFKDPKFVNGDGHWYRGETSKEFDIKLKPKK